MKQLFLVCVLILMLIELGVAFRLRKVNETKSESEHYYRLIYEESNEWLTRIDTEKACLDLFKDEERLNSKEALFNQTCTSKSEPEESIEFLFSRAKPKKTSIIVCTCSTSPNILAHRILDTIPETSDFIFVIVSARYGESIFKLVPLSGRNYAIDGRWTYNEVQSSLSSIVQSWLH